MIIISYTMFYAYVWSNDRIPLRTVRDLWSDRMMKERRYRIQTSQEWDRPLVIAQVSDFHNGDAQAVSKVLRRCRPDLIALTGDLFIGYGSREADEEKQDENPYGKGFLAYQENVLPLVRCCTELAPTYFSLGNHEWVVTESDFAALRAEGLIILDNQWVRDEERGLVIGGLTSAMMTDFQRYRRKYGSDADYPHWSRHTDRINLRAKDGWLNGFTRQEGYKILLSHHPEYWCLRQPMLCKKRIDLVLSGHAHGGQIRLFGRGLYSPGQGILPRYTGGVFQGRFGTMVVSRGTTNTVPKIPRLFNPAEGVVIECLPKKRLHASH